MKKRNSLIEFYRFFFAMNIVKNHGYFPYQGKYFSPGRISVEFFFILSGFLLRKSLDKYINLPYFKGLFLMLKHKILAMGIPLLVALLMHLPYKLITGSAPWWDITDWGYLWYVFDMLVIDIFYFTIRKLVKKEKLFFAIVASIFVVASVFHAIPTFFSTGWFRALGMMSLGILISYIPPIKMKKPFILLIPLIFIWCYVLRIMLFDFSFIEEEILDLLIYPALIYLTFQIPIQSKILNYLGALSFGLFAYQSVSRLIYILGYENVWICFVVVVSLTIFTDGNLRLIRYLKSQKRSVETA